MPLLQMIVILVVVGVALWAVNTYLARWMSPPILKILNVAVVIGVIIWLLEVFGVLGYIGGINVGRR